MKRMFEPGLEPPSELAPDGYDMLLLTGTADLAERAGVEP